MIEEAVTIVMTASEAESLSFGLSDLLCWHRGFDAARAGTVLNDNDPMGVEAVRTINLKLKAAMK